MTARWGALAALVGLLVASLGIPADPAAAQAAFRVTYEVDRSRPDRLRVIGRVYNEARADALDVYVTAEALDAAGKVVARGVAFCAASLPQRGSATFAANVPAMPGVVGFRVLVTGYRFGVSGESP